MNSGLVSVLRNQTPGANWVTVVSVGTNQPDAKPAAPPPPDPWLAGESVSYYYFGYLLVSVMTRLSDTIASVPIGVGYNLGLAMIVALAVTGAFGLIYNLTAPSERGVAEGGPGTPARGFNSKPLWRPMIFGLAGALLLAVMGNLEGG